MAGIFISYRRDDAAADAGRLFDDLKRRCASNRVFMDLDAAAGVDFRETLSEQLDTCDVLLALIGPRWLQLKNEVTGQRRLEEDEDLVRLEIATALAKRKTVIPVILPGAKVPRRDDLPEPIQELAWRNAFELRHNRWTSDVNELVRQMPRKLRCSEVLRGTALWQSWTYLLFAPIVLLTALHVFAVSPDFPYKVDPYVLAAGTSALVGIVHASHSRFGLRYRLLLGLAISLGTATSTSILVPLLFPPDTVLPQTLVEVRLFATFTASILTGYLAATVLTDAFTFRGN